MLSALLKTSGAFVLMLIYGKKYAEIHSRKFGLMVLLSLVNVFWLMSLLFLVTGSASGDTALCLVLAIGYPIVIAIWTFLERKKQGMVESE